MYPEINQYSQMQTGSLFLKKLSGGGSYCVGDWEEPAIKYDAEEKFIPNLKTPGGGKSESIERINGMMISFNLFNFSASNVALMLYGTTAEETAGIGTAEAHTAYKNSLLRLSGLIDEVTLVTDVGATTTYVLDTDYYVEPSGIVIPETGAIATADTGTGVAIEVTYTTQSATTIQTLVNKGEEYFASFISKNETRSNNIEIADFFRIKFKIAAEMPLADTDYKKVSLEAEVLADTTKNYSAGLSQHMTIYRTIQ